MKILSIILITIFLTSCVKTECEETYTIKGQVMNGTTGEKFANQSFEVVEGKKDFGDPNSGWTTIATGKTDSEGKFNVSYKCIERPGAKINLYSQFFHLENIPVNQNVDQVFYKSTMGKLKIILKTSNPLEINNDTLFLAKQKYPGSMNDEIVIDTILRTINGEYKTLNSPTPSLTIFKGRGSIELSYDPVEKVFRSAKNRLTFSITGDPFIDSVTIIY